MNENTFPQKKAWYIVLISAILGCSISSGFPQFSMTVTQLSEATGFSEAFLLSGDTVKSASIVVAMMVSGYTYKKFGVRINLIISIICTVLPQFLLPSVTSAAIFMVLKVVQGFASLCFPVLLLIIMDVISEKNAGLATAVFNGVFYSGGGVGGILAGICISNWGWKSSYYVLGMLMLLLGIVWILTVRYEPAPADSEPEDGGKKKGTLAPILKMPVTWLLIFGFISTTFVVQAITVDLSIFSEYLGYSALEISKLNVAVSLGLIISCLISGKISDIIASRMSNRAIARIIALMIGPALIIVSTVMLITLDLTSFMLFYAVAFIFSFSGSWGLGTFYSVLPEVYDDEKLPVITGIAGGSGDMGMPAAPLLVGVIFGARGMWNMGWGVCIVVAALSVVACIALIRNSSVRAGKRL